MRIVALHGQLGMASDWEGLAVRLAKAGHELEAVDLWHYLEEEGASHGYSLAGFGERFNQEQGADQVLVGYSMGGRLALHALIDQPEKWKAAVIVSAHLGLSQGERKVRSIADDAWANKLENLPWSEFLDEWNKQVVLGNDVMPDRSGLVVRKAEILRSYRFWSLAVQDYLLEKLSSIEVPVLWVVGAEDEKFCKEGETAVKMLKNAKLLKVHGSGHRVPWEAEANFVKAIIEWINLCGGDK